MLPFPTLSITGKSLDAPPMFLRANLRSCSFSLSVHLLRRRHSVMINRSGGSQGEGGGADPLLVIAGLFILEELLLLAWTVTTLHR